MLKKLHPDAATVLTERDLLAQNPEMEKNVGCVIRFKWNEKDAKALGTAKRDFTYTIIGVQKIWDGRVAYRVLCNGYKDTFGCPALPDEIDFVN